MYISEIIKRNNNNIDAVRIMASLLVVWCHSFALSGGKGDFISKLLPQTAAGEFGVSIFFFFSGLLVTNSLLTNKDPLRFVVSRFFRIVPAYLIVVIISAFIIGPIFTTLTCYDYLTCRETWIYFFHNAYFDTKFVLPGLWTTLPDPFMNGSLWSLPIEIGCYITVLVIFILCSRFHINKLIPLLGCLLCSLMPHTFFTEMLGIGYSNISGLFLFCFTVGAFFSVYKDKVSVDRFVIVALIMSNMFLWRYANIIRFFFPVSVSIILLYIATIPPLVTKKLRHDISYGMYIWHWPLMQMIVSITDCRNPYCLFGIALPISIIVSYISCRVIEEPCISYGKRFAGVLQTKLHDMHFGGTIVLLVLFISIVIAKFFL